MINKKTRRDHEPPAAVEQWGWKYHHTGIPTQQIMPDEEYLPLYRFYVSGFKTSPFGIEWMRFEKESPVSPLVQTVPHIAFEVEDIDREIALHNLKVISEPGDLSEGVRAAMIEHNGTPIELIEFHINKCK
jgi:hypothetical protein